ncbi:DUF2894 domain-containing protein [Ramlibacter sp. 2FC]|uniref:DUF2894 domain-containing protein n=1 Tax=Ramlibacter sp. 2FC TaxID=2502188 RepID=UPI0010F8DD9F|nr:DUF2894 domain-containing protein [Ramlibacter sp. 2FC]
MSESVLVAAALSPLERLRSVGAQRFDPLRFHYLERLSQRMQAAPAGLRPILEGKLEAALQDYEQRFSQARKAAEDQVAGLSGRYPGLARELRRLLAAGDYAGLRRIGAQAAADTGCAPLAELNQHIRQLAQGGSELEARPDMKSVVRFRESWSRIAAEDQVDQAMGRGPENAGPLNSHLLVLRSLGLMRQLSPDYLRRFLSHLDALLWLDQASQKCTSVEAKPARRSRSKK